MRRFALLFLAILGALLAVHSTSAAANPGSFLLHDGERVLVVGDSITYAGGYVQYLEAYLRTRFPNQRFEVINLGLPSETVTGLSEPDHPFPRPNVHERLDRALQRIKPHVVIACYGMNDGIYYPFSEDRFAQYQQGMRDVIRKSRTAGARIILMTPPPFDPVPVKDKLLPEGAPKYSWVNPFVRYHEVLDRYSDWVLSLRKEGLIVADPHRETAEFLTRVRRRNPDFTLAGDGVHPAPGGHALIALALLEALGAPALVDRAEVEARTRQVIAGDVTDVIRSGDSLELRWLTRVPMAADPEWPATLAPLSRFHERLNRHLLRVRGLREGRYRLYEGDRLVSVVTGADLERGVDLNQFPELTTNRQAVELLKLVRQRERLLSSAWITAVGHKRPQTPTGLPLPEAQQKAAPLEQRIHELSRPVTLHLRLVPDRL